MSLPGNEQSVKSPEVTQIEEKDHKKEKEKEHPHHHEHHLFHKHEAHSIEKKGYKLGKLIGEGSYAKVYETEYVDPKNGRKITLAAKVINKKRVPKDFLKKFFPRELYAMSRCNHPNIVRLHSVIDVPHEDRFYVFMQMCTNGDMLEFVKANGLVVEDQAKIWFTQVVRGMRYLHGLNIAHRDLKLENLLLTQGYNIKISDFGFARLVLDKYPNSETFCGSISYAPPEILRGRKYNPKISDMWSLGIVLFVMVNKCLPFDDKSIKGIYEAQMCKNWRFRDKVRNKLSKNIKSLVDELLQPVAKNRLTIEELWTHKWIQDPKNAEVKKFESKKTIRVHESLRDVKLESDELMTLDKVSSQIKLAQTQHLRRSRPPSTKSELSMSHIVNYHINKPDDSMSLKPNTGIGTGSSEDNKGPSSIQSTEESSKIDPSASTSEKTGKIESKSSKPSMK